MIKESIVIYAEEEDKGKRLDVFVDEELDGYSRTFVQKLIENKNIIIEGYSKIKNGLKLKGNEQIIINIPEDEEMDIEPENIPLNIVYEDEYIVIINKQPGLVVHPAPGNYTGTLVNGVLYHINNMSIEKTGARPGIVHRLDKDTSGLIIVAKTDSTHRILSEMFKERKIEKEYLAIVNGRFREKKGRIETLIGRDYIDRKKMAVITDGGKIAITNYNVICDNEKGSLLKLQIETGRTHQIRVHMKYEGHQIMGDKTYGIKKDGVAAERQMLHSYRLKFEHPITKETVEYFGEIPQDFKDVMEKMNFKIEGLV